VPDSITSTCCGFVPQLVVTTCCTTHPQRIEVMCHTLCSTGSTCCRLKSTTNRKPTASPQQKSTQQVVQQAASLTTTWTTCRTASPQLIELMESDSYSTPDRAYATRQCNGGDTQSRNLRKKLAQVSCASFLHQIFVQVHASSADDTSNKNGRSWTKQITFSILYVDHSIGTQNFYLNNLNNFKK